MSINININYSQKSDIIPLPFSLKKDIDIKIEPLQEDFTVGVSNFPTFIKTSLKSNLALVRAEIALNMISQRLIVDTDPLLVANMDSMTLADLDVGQNITVYSI